MSVEPQIIEKARAADIIAVMQRHGVELKKRGSEFVALCPFHAEQTPSFSVNPAKNVFFCHGCGARGDSITFLQAHAGLDFGDAVRALVGGIGVAMALRTPTLARAEKWELIIPVRGDAPEPPIELGDRLVSARWAYRNAAGELLFFICRFEVPGGKDIRPLSFWRNRESGELSWRWKSVPAPRPLLHLDLLATHPQAQVVVVEGEKATDALERLIATKFPYRKKTVVVTWPGGANGLHSVDLEPLRGRSLVIWPDADEPGAKAADELCRRLGPMAAQIKRLDPPTNAPGGWDAADAEADCDFDFCAFAKTARLVVPDPLAPSVATPAIAVASPDNFNDQAVTGDLDARRDAFTPEKALVPSDHYVPTLAPADQEAAHAGGPPQDRAESMPVAAASSSPASPSAPGLNAVADPPAMPPMLFDPMKLVPDLMPSSADARDGVTGTFPLTELGNVYRIAAKYGNDLRYVPNLDQFLLWRDGAWHPDEGAKVRRLLARLPKSLMKEAAEHAGAQRPDDAAHALTWARKSQSAMVISNGLKLLKDLDQLHVPFHEVDGNTMLVGLDGGRQVVELHSGECRAARREDYVTRSLGVVSIGDASKATLWNKFLGEVFPGDVELIDWLQRFVGYCLTADYREQIFLFLHGSGSNGKSVLIAVLRALLGGYGGVVAASTLMAQRRPGGAPSPDVLDMAGSRLLLASETSSGSAFDEQFLKGWTGGDPQKARANYGKDVTFMPVGKLMIAGNHRPRIVGTDHAVWRRVRLVPFERTFTEDEKDPLLTRRLMAEMPSIAAWAVAGCVEWQRRGLLDTPASVRQASASYAEEQDTLGEFLKEKTQAGINFECIFAELYGEYVRWAEACCMKPMSRQAFGRQIKERPFKKRHTRDGDVILGLRLRGPL